MTGTTITPIPPVLSPTTTVARRRGAPTVRRALLYAGLTVAVILVLLPFVWMLLGSFKDQGEILRNPQGWWPEQPTLANYSRWFGELHIGSFFVNSLVVALLTVAGNLLFCSMVGYALTKLNFSGRRPLLGLVLVTLMVPHVVTFVPLFVLVSNLGLSNSLAALILPFLTAPIGVFLMRQFIAEIPDSLIEAARIDGANEAVIFARIILPLLGPSLATLGILTFMTSWNSFLWPLVAAQTQDNYTLPVALALFSQGENATDYGLLLAGSVLVIAPIVVFFIALQRFFLQSVASVGIK